MPSPATGAAKRPPHPMGAHLLEGPILRSLFVLGLPIMGANVLQMAYQFIDAFWVGRLGAAAVAAVSISAPIMFLMISAGLGFAIAGTTLISQYAGARDHAMVNHVAAQTLLTMVAISAILGAAGFVLAPGLLRLLGVAPDVYDNALIFLRVSFVSLPFGFAYFMFQGLMRGVGEATVPLYIVAGTVAVNFVLVPLLTFGMFGFPELGILGAALATMTAQGLAAFVGLYLLGSGRYGIRIIWREFRPDFAFIKRAFLLGYPASIEQSARGLGLTIMTFLIVSFGTITTAAYGIGANVLNFVIVPAMGLSMATSVLVGQNIGAGQIERAEKIAGVSAWISFGALSAIGLLSLLFAHHIAAFFVPNDRPVIEEAAVFIRIVSWSFGFIGLQFALMGVLRASGNMMAAMVISLVSQWVLQFPLAYVLSKHTSLGAHGLWWAFPISNIATALISAAWFARGTWKTRRLVEPTPEEAEAQAVDDQVVIS